MLNRLKTHSGFIGLFAVMVVMALFFHYPIQIIDALSSEPVPGFGINISVWRVISEPFMGPLLFYLRADQPLLEFIILLVWIISLSLIVSFTRILLSNENERTILDNFTKNIEELKSVQKGNTASRPVEDLLDEL